MQNFWAGRVKRAEMTRDVHNRTVRYAGERGSARSSISRSAA